MLRRLFQELCMNELLTLNIFAQSAPLAMLGIAVCGALIALPWWLQRGPGAGRGGCGGPSPCD